MTPDMRRLALLLALLFSAVPAFAQSTTVSGTITDAGAQAWAFGTVQFTFRPSNSNPTGQYFWNGAPFDKSTTIPATPLPLDAAGSFSGVSVPSNNFINPSGSTWTVQVCPASTTPCFSQNLTITGATQNISAQIIPPAIVLNLTVPLLGAKAYTDPEVTGALPGTSYFNITDNKLHLCVQTGFPPCTWVPLGGGSVNSVTLGSLPPLFNTTNVGTATDPSFTFARINEAANLVYASPCGIGGTPQFRSLCSSDFSGGVVTSVVGTVSQIDASPTTGNVILSFPATVLFPGSVTAEDSITTLNGDLVASGVGRVIAGGQISTSGGGLNILNSQSLRFTGRAQIFSDSSSNVLFRNNSNTADVGIFAEDVTVDSLTPGNCVQAGTLGILTTIASPCPNISATQIETATLSPGCTTASGNNTQDNCTNTLTWSHAFANTSYIAVCWGIDSGMSGDHSTVDSLTLAGDTQTTTTITVITQSLRGKDAAFETINCHGIHP